MKFRLGTLTEIHLTLQMSLNKIAVKEVNNEKPEYLHNQMIYAVDLICMQ